MMDERYHMDKSEINAFIFIRLLPTKVFFLSPVHYVMSFIIGEGGPIIHSFIVTLREKEDEIVEEKREMIKMKTRKRMTVQKTNRSVCEAVVVLKEKSQDGKHKDVRGVIENINSYSLILDTSHYDDKFHYKFIPMSEIHGILYNVVKEDDLDVD